MNKTLKTLLVMLALGCLSNVAQAQTNNAYGDNQVQVEPGIFAIYTGDINQDGTTDGIDFLIMDVDIQNFGGGYVATDLNGDGSVDGSDFLLLDVNIQNFIGVVAPI